mmetsp:Transcript_4271/g.11064  ORF Transcript_4271/g.11064 Transcript_4271/m.11064 type:complete len:95 (-) Transcript_4271:390-674(-)
MGRIHRRQPASSCLCCGPGGEGAVYDTIIDVRAFALKQRLTFLHVWRYFCPNEAPRDVLMHIFELAAVTERRVVRRQVMPDVSALSLCGSIRDI